MLPFLIMLHVLVCIALIIIVLLQAGKGAEVGASFGAGSSQTVFGASGGKSFMSRVTTWTAITFMLTSLALAYIYGGKSLKSVMPASVQQSAPAPSTTFPSPAEAPTEGEKK